MNDFSAFGEKLKAIRDSRNLNLSNVSELTGISKAMLSKIERGESVPTITTVWKIANGLKVTLNSLAGEADSSYIIKDISNTTPLIDEGGLFKLYNIFPFSPLDGIQVFYGVFKAGYHYEPPMFIHESSGKEYCIVFKGELDVVIGSKTYHLEEGCGIDFDSQEEHGYINGGKEDAIVCFLLI
ncbi:putative transcriptional regulator [Desulfitobacterium dichloroeliminans LMG P-21439]|uniref:Putative transcriptional regulator n=1 Tax=Desulfitobacterium dichloroeliminans (strain LMG P-21439 / DCA1) TaxID=871963 RepID=L0F8E9_DESDL|nr:XRE family transcriptional regulator [Desulfitobacterium dichloroeliminans]AGA68931.1 putative transcriptional regulator [Desulfitobacterium dichloroeliminans LMG P-21439]